MNLEYLRKRNIFGQPSYQQDQPPASMSIPPEEEQDTSQDEEQQPPTNETPGLNDIFSGLFNAARSQPPGPASKAYSDFLAKGVPTPDQYPPGKINRLSAILGGASEGWQRGAGAGIRTAQEILDSPYQKAIAAHKLRGGMLEKGAEVESKDLGRAASFAKSATTAYDAAQTQRRLAIRDQHQFDHWDAADRAAARRAANTGTHWVTGQTDGKIHGFKTLPDGSVQHFEGPKIGQTMDEKQKAAFDLFTKQEGVRQPNRIALANTQSANRTAEEDNRQNGRMQIRQYLQDNKDFKFLAVKGGNYIAVDPTDPSKTVDTGIKTGTLTEKDHIEAGIQGRVQVVDAQAAQNQLRDAKNNAARMALQQQRLDAGAAARHTPQRQNAEIQVRMRKFLAANGQNAKDYFEIDAAGNPTAMKPGDPDDPDYKAIYQYVFGKSKVK